MRKINQLLLSATLLVSAPLVLAADSLDSLLQEVKSVRATAEQQFQQRAAEFNAASPDQQAQMLKAAETKRGALAATADKLAASFSENEVAITSSTKQMQEKARSLGLSELFGLSRQVAGDVATILEQSLISAQFADDRIEFLRSYASSQKAPTSAELQRLWFEMSREMSASGQVAKFRTKVVQPGGASVDSAVVRIGPFTASSDGKFLAYLPELRTLNVYPRQPPDEFMELLDGFDSVNTGYAQAVVDSTRGVLMSLYVERPTLKERIELGEAVGYVIIAVGIAGTLAFLFQLVHLVLVRMAVTKQLKDLDNLSQNNPLGRVLLAFKGDPTLIEQDADVAELRIAEAVLRETPRLEARGIRKNRSPR